MASNDEIGPAGGVFSVFLGGYVLLQRPMTSFEMNLLVAGFFVVLGIVGLLALVR